jgi:hypothetical protein
LEETSLPAHPVLGAARAAAPGATSAAEVVIARSATETVEMELSFAL